MTQSTLKVYEGTKACSAVSQSHPCSVMNLYHSIVLRGLVWQHKDVKIIAQWINLLWKLAPFHRVIVLDVGARMEAVITAPPLPVLISVGRPAAPQLLSPSTEPAWSNHRGVWQSAHQLRIHRSESNSGGMDQISGVTKFFFRVGWNRVYSSTKSSTPFDQTIVCHLGY